MNPSAVVNAKAFLFPIVIPALAACSTTRILDGHDPEWRYHVIAADNIGRLDVGKGVYTQVENHETKSDLAAYKCTTELTNANRGSQEGRRDFATCHIDHVIESLVQDIGLWASCPSSDRPRRLLFFIHGGLNDPIDARNRAINHVGQLLGQPDERGCHPVGSVYPIFLNWNSGFTNTYSDQLFNVYDSERIEGFAPYDRPNDAKKVLTPLRFVSDLLIGVASAPNAWANQLVQFYDGARPAGTHKWGAGTLDSFNSYEKYEKPAWGAISSNSNVYFSNTICPLQNNSCWSVSSSELTDQYELVSPDTGMLLVTCPFKTLTTPIADSLGQRSWDNQRRRTRAALRQETEYQEGPPGAYSKGSGIFWHFMEKFAIERRKNGRDRSPRHYLIEISIVAHSMGAMIANQIVREFGDQFCNPDVQACRNGMFANIVYMGSASSIREFYNTVGIYLSEHPEARFYNLMLHPASEAHEEARPLPLVPRGSLLEWIDTMYVESDSVFDRTMGKWDNIVRSKHVFPDCLQKRMFFKVFWNIDGNPVRHSDFGLVLARDGRVQNAPNEDTSYAFWSQNSWGHPSLFADDSRSEREHSEERCRLGAPLEADALSVE